MNFQVPQFIDIEDKVFGPLSVKQFVYILGGAGLSFVIFRFLPLIFAFILIPPVAGFALAMAFYRPNNRPFVFMLESMVNYMIGSKLYVWNKKPKKKEETEKKTADSDTSIVDQMMSVPKLSESKLSDLGWSLDIKETVKEKK